MRAYVFLFLLAQFVGMGHDLYDKFPKAKEMFTKANDILKFNITEIMFEGTDEDLRQTKVTQPSIFLHSVILATVLGEDFKPDMVAGHSLGEFSALVANRTLSFEDGLRLVSQRAMAMQKACDANPGTMAAIINLPDEKIKSICDSISEVVIPANFNCPGQVVISGSIKGVEEACEKMKEAGAKRALPLKVGGAFHSPLMEPAREELADAIQKTKFVRGICPIYQNVTGQAVNDPEIIKSNLIKQLTAPVYWTQTMENMIAAGVNQVVEVGPGTVLQGLFRKMNSNIELSSASVE